MGKRKEITKEDAKETLFLLMIAVLCLWSMGAFVLEVTTHDGAMFICFVGPFLIVISVLVLALILLVITSAPIHLVMYLRQEHNKRKCYFDD